MRDHVQLGTPTTLFRGGDRGLHGRPLLRGVVVIGACAMAACVAKLARRGTKWSNKMGARGHTAGVSTK